MRIGLPWDAGAFGVEIQPSLELGDRDESSPTHPDHAQVGSDVLVKEVDRDAEGVRCLLLAHGDPRDSGGVDAHHPECPRVGQRVSTTGGCVRHD
jgi:hypothetical protein